MKETILKELKKIEERENIKIIHAVESGSRAWGFASTDSDYDVRFIYIRKPSYYLKLEKTRDVIELPINDALDINGWDLQKALRLLYSSNPTLFEWFNSPIVYKTTDFYKELNEEIYKYFSLKSGLYHYLSTAERNYKRYFKEDYVKAKKYFYVLRPLLACRWILERKCPPPMLFSKLVETQLEDEMKVYVDELLNIKMNSPEVKEIEKVVPVNEFIDRNIEKLKYEVKELKEQKNKNWNELNSMFLKGLKEFYELDL